MVLYGKQQLFYDSTSQYNPNPTRGPKQPLSTENIRLYIIFTRSGVYMEHIRSSFKVICISTVMWFHTQLSHVS